VRVTIFGPAWNHLELSHLEAFLQDAPSEPLEWEVKRDFNTRSVRKQVCGFANSHDGGYLILGAEGKVDGTWAFDGAKFPNGDPPSDVSDVIAGGGVTPYPDGLNVRQFNVAERQVAVVRIPPTPTPPCMTQGTVYERVAGKTISVIDPARLASLFERGDAAQQAGVNKAERIAGRVPNHAGADAGNAQFALGLAAPDYPLDVTSRLFSPSFNTDAQERIFSVLGDALPTPLGVRIFPSVTQFELLYRVEADDRRLGYDWLVSVSRDGAVGIHWTMGVQRSTVPSLVTGVVSPLGKAWQYAHETLSELGLEAPRYLHVAVGVPLPPPVARVARGGVFGPSEDALASIQRELRRAGGEMIFENEAQP
jgi:Putative DNA-binding domain